MELLGGEEAQGFGIVGEVGVEAVDEGLAFAAVQGLEVFQADEFVEAGAEAFVGPAQDFPELAAGPVNIGEDDVFENLQPAAPTKLFDEDPELLEIVTQINTLNAEQKKALKLVLHSMVT